MTLRTEYVDVDFKLKLKKDLHENEVICNRCKGTGLTIADHPFGLASDKGKYAEMFPHKKQTIVGCNHCYVGVQKTCKYCSKLLGRSLRCNCEGYRNQERLEQRQKDKNRWDKADKITWQEAMKLDTQFYLDNDDKFFYDIDELIEYIQYALEDEEMEIEDIDNLHIYTTETTNITFDAYDIIENACSDLHEEAYDRIDKSKFEELQTFLDEFKKPIESDTKTYYPNWKIGVIVKKEDLGL